LERRTQLLRALSAGYNKRDELIKSIKKGPGSEADKRRREAEVMSQVDANYARLRDKGETAIENHLPLPDEFQMLYTDHGAESLTARYAAAGTV